MKTAGWNMLEVATGDTLLISAKVTTTPVQALLDSGTATSIISASLAMKLGLRSGESHTIRGMSGRAAVQLVRDVVITLQNVARRLPFAIIADLDAVSSAFGRPIDLVLGLDMLTDRFVALDLANSRFTLGPSGGFAGGPGWTVLPLKHGANRELLVQASVAGLPLVPLIFDLGSSTGLTLSSTYVDEHGLADRNLRSTAAVGGVEGIRIADAFTLGRADLGGLPVIAIPTLAARNWLSTSAVGNMGLPLIAQFDVVLDVTVGKLWLRLANSRHRLPMLKDRSGLGLAASPSVLTVVHVAAGSPAEKNGWVMAERIMAVNNHPIGADYTRGTFWRWRFSPAGTLVKLDTATGETRELRLADYY